MSLEFLLAENLIKELIEYISIHLIYASYIMEIRNKLNDAN